MAFSRDVEAALLRASQETGVPVETLRAFVRVESGGNPHNQTGSYMGLGQLSRGEFARHGGGDIFNPYDNARATAIKIQAETQDFVRRYGRQPTTGELYLQHQQGVAGAAAHWSNPNTPAWQSVRRYYPNESVAKQAIWGNVPDAVKRQVGSVDNLTSKQFADLWNTRVMAPGQQTQPMSGAVAAAPYDGGAANGVPDHGSGWMRPMALGGPKATTVAPPEASAPSLTPRVPGADDTNYNPSVANSPFQEFNAQSDPVMPAPIVLEPGTPADSAPASAPASPGATTPQLSWNPAQFWDDRMLGGKADGGTVADPIADIIAEHEATYNKKIQPYSGFSTRYPADARESSNIEDRRGENDWQYMRRREAAEKLLQEHHQARPPVADEPLATQLDRLSWMTRNPDRPADGYRTPLLPALRGWLKGTIAPGLADGGAPSEAAIRDVLAEYDDPRTAYHSKLREAPEEATLSAHKQPWYRAVPNWIADRIYGPNATAPQAEGVRHILGPDNPLNVPGQLAEGLDTAAEGYRRGDARQAVLGGIEVASVLPIPGARGMGTAAKAARKAYVPQGLNAVAEEVLRLRAEQAALKPHERIQPNNLDPVFATDHEAYNRVPDRVPQRDTPELSGALPEGVERELPLNARAQAFARHRDALADRTIELIRPYLDPANPHHDMGYFYNNTMREAMDPILGKAGSDARAAQFQKSFASTSPRTGTEQNLRNSSLLDVLDEAGRNRLPIGEDSLAGYNMMKMHGDMYDRMRDGSFRAAANTKPAQYGENSVGNLGAPMRPGSEIGAAPVAGDTHYIRGQLQQLKDLTGQVPGGWLTADGLKEYRRTGKLPLESGVADTLSPVSFELKGYQTEYPIVTDVARAASRRLAERGITMPGGRPVQPAQIQSYQWFGMGDKTGLQSDPKTISTLMNEAVNRTAQALGMSPQQVLELYARRQIPLLADGGAVEEPPGFADGGAVTAALAVARKRVERDPSDAQKEAGNYAKGHVNWHGLDLAIENPKGATRSGTGRDGKTWRVAMPADYGYVKRTEGADGDHADIYLGPDHDAAKVFVVDQIDADTGKFDEHKCLLSYPSRKAALADYRRAFSDGKADDRIGAVTEMTVDEFKTWVRSDAAKKPLKGRKGFAEGGLAGADEIKGVLAEYDDPRVAYHSKLVDGPAPVAPWDRPGTKSPVTGTLSATPDRPADWAVSSGLAETLSPTVQGFGAGQMSADAIDAYKAAHATDGDVDRPSQMRSALGSGIMAAMAMMPMSGKGKAKANMTPFYGPDVGPKGVIGDPAARAATLGLRSGLPGAPTEAGFFNPASGALMQDGVAPKQTITYFEKQLGSRGGKLPPGQWDKIKADLNITAPDQVIERDALVKAIDARTPQFHHRLWSTATERELPASAKTKDFVDYNGPRYDDYSTPGNFDRHDETALGYADPHGEPRDGHTRANTVTPWQDPHFEHQNIEGWVRSKDRTEYGPPADADVAAHQAAKAIATPEYRAATSALDREWFGNRGELRDTKDAIRDAERVRLQAEANATSDPRRRADLIHQHNDMDMADFELLGTRDRLAAHRAMFDDLSERRLAVHRANVAPLRVPSTTRVIDEVQPQRAQKQRDHGTPTPPEQVAAVVAERDAMRGKLDNMFAAAATEFGITPSDVVRSRQGHLDTTVSLRRIADGTVGTPEQQGRAKAVLAEIAVAQDRAAHLGSQLIAMREGVPPSPYSGDTNAATGLLTKNILRDAAADDVSRLAWAPGEVQAERYGQLLRDITGLRYSPHTQNLSWRTSADTKRDLWSRGEQVAPEKLAEYVGKDAAKRLLAQPMTGVPPMPGSGTTAPYIGRGWQQLDFPKGMDLGGDGMTGYYGDGAARHGIFGDTLRALIRRVTGQEPPVNPHKVGEKFPWHGTSAEPVNYPSVELTPEARATIKRIGLPTYATGGKIDDET